MTPSEIIKRRLFNQKISHSTFSKPEQVVDYLGAMQAQEFAQAKWAIGLRCLKITEKDFDNTFNQGKILRTHLLRPTWHFVSPENIKHILVATAPRVHAANKYMYKNLGLNAQAFSKGADAIAKAVEGRELTRPEIQAALKKSKLKADGLHLVYQLMNAELEGIICSGPRRGKQFTYALLAEKTPKTKELSREESILHLMRKYFTSRGPARLRDFAYWASFTIGETDKYFKVIEREFDKTIIDGEAYYFKDSGLPTSAGQRTFLMPDYDEYGMSYKDRSMMSSKGFSANVSPYHLLIVNGKFAGQWKPKAAKKSVNVDCKPLVKTSAAAQKEIKRAISRFMKFFQHSA